MSAAGKLYAVGVWWEPEPDELARVITMARRAAHALRAMMRAISAADTTAAAPGPAIAQVLDALYTATSTFLLYPDTLNVAAPQGSDDAWVETGRVIEAWCEWHIDRTSGRATDMRWLGRSLTQAAWFEWAAEAGARRLWLVGPYSGDSAIRAVLLSCRDLAVDYRAYVNQASSGAPRDALWDALALQWGGDFVAGQAEAAAAEVERESERLAARLRADAANLASSPPLPLEALRSKLVDLDALVERVLPPFAITMPDGQGPREDDMTAQSRYREQLRDAVLDIRPTVRAWGLSEAVLLAPPPSMARTTGAPTVVSNAFHGWRGGLAGLSRALTGRIRIQERWDSLEQADNPERAWRLAYLLVEVVSWSERVAGLEAGDAISGSRRVEPLAGDRARLAEFVYDARRAVRATSVGSSFALPTIAALADAIKSNAKLHEGLAEEALVVARAVNDLCSVRAAMTACGPDRLELPPEPAVRSGARSLIATEAVVAAAAFYGRKIAAFREMYRYLKRFEKVAVGELAELRDSLVPDYTTLRERIGEALRLLYLGAEQWRVPKRTTLLGWRRGDPGEFHQAAATVVYHTKERALAELDKQRLLGGLPTRGAAASAAGKAIPSPDGEGSLFSDIATQPQRSPRPAHPPGQVARAQVLGAKMVDLLNAYHATRSDPAPSPEANQPPPPKPDSIERAWRAYEAACAEHPELEVATDKEVWAWIREHGAGPGDEDYVLPAEETFVTYLIKARRRRGSGKNSRGGAVDNGKSIVRVDQVDVRPRRHGRGKPDET